MRYAPQAPFPPYAYVPGRHPHPVTHPLGHSYGLPTVTAAPLDPAQPEHSGDFLFAIDLFNAGYYWEAHESWERLWLSAGRTGPVADLLKGLIKLAAAGVKAREGNIAGVRRHAARAAELFRSADEQSGTLQGLFEAIDGSRLLDDTRAFAIQPAADPTPSVAGRCVLPLRIAFRSQQESGRR